LEAVGHPHAVNPDRALRRIARERGWPVLAFGTRPPAAGQPAPGGPQGRPDPASRVHVSRAADRDHELVTLRGFPGAPIRRTKVSRTQNVRTRQPGTHARPAAGGGPRDGLPGSRGPRLVTWV